MSRSINRSNVVAVRNAALVVVGVQEVFDVRKLLHLDFEHPAGAVGVAVDHFGPVVQRLVDFDDRAVLLTTDEPHALPVAAHGVLVRRRGVDGLCRQRDRALDALQPVLRDDDAQRACLAPPLIGIAGRTYIAGKYTNTPENMIRFIRFPQQMDPQIAMPNMNMTERDGRDIAAYLYTLQ